MDHSVAPPIYLDTAQPGLASGQWAECAHASCAYYLYMYTCLHNIHVCACMGICIVFMYVHLGVYV